MTFSETYFATLPFKGNRNYIQGPDLVDMVMGLFDNETIKRAKFSSHSFISAPDLRIDITDKAPQKTDAEVPFRGQVTYGDVSRWITVDIDPAKSSEITRVGFDEAQLRNSNQIDGDIILRDEPSPFSLSETIVSMKKQLLEHAHPSGDQKWIFTSVDYTASTENWSKLAIKIEHNFQNKLVKSSILADDTRIGFLYFSLVTL